MDLTPIHPKVTPIYQTSVFKFSSLAELEEYYTAPDHAGRYGYSRSEHPNSDELVAEVAKLEGATGGVATGAGLAGLLAAVLAVCQAGDHVLCPAELYGGSVVLLSNELTRLGIETSYVPLADLYDIARHRKSNTKLVLAEVLSNPLLVVLDGPRLAHACQEQGILLLIDSSFTSPMLTQPLSWGADMVWHSATKYLAGHSDVTAGVVVARDPAIAKNLRRLATNLGLMLAPMDSWLAVRGLKTLRLRMRQHSENAMSLARFLADSPAVAQVFYPGLESHPGHALAAHQLLGGLYGGMLSIRLVDDSVGAVEAFIQKTKLFPLAPSLAGVASSCSYPAATSHRGLTPAQRASLGITPGVLRLSVGIEEVADLLVDLEHALGEG
jgi:cystathionine beta-lyase/cystathionine gamma-synthase